MADKYVYNKWDHGNAFLKAAEKAARKGEAEVQHHGSSHVKVTCLKDGEFKNKANSVPTHTLGVGLSKKLWKWFVSAGLIGSVLIYLWSIGG